MKKPNSNHIIFIIFISFSLLWANAETDPSKDIVYLENSKIQLGFDKTTGALLVFKDLEYSYDYLEIRMNYGTPWEIYIQQTPGNESERIGHPAMFEFNKPDPYKLELMWYGFPEATSEELKVIVTIRLEKDKSLSSWKISLQNTKGLLISKVIFPKVAGLKDMGEEYLAVPIWMGELIKNPRTHLVQIRNREKKYEWSYPGILSMQFMALYDINKCGLYVSCNDSLAYRKSFSLTLDTLKTLTYQVKNYPSLNSTSNSFRLPYAAILGSFKGDWITAAEQYREWGSKQKWSSTSRFKNRLSPEWLEKTALWIWNRSKSSNVLLPAADLKERLKLPVNVFWHWWHGCSYDDGFPEYFPPREGKEPFIQALSAAQEKNIRAIVYMNVLQWGDATESWKTENAAAWSVKDINGNMRSHVYNKFTGRSLTNMCIATEFWRNKYASLSEKALNIYGINGIYMDQTCLSRRCYDETHGHPLGGGNYWIKNFAKLEDQIRLRASSDNQPVLAGEGCGEVWLPNLDVFLALQVSKERYAGTGGGEPIPYFQAVYHQYAITYGNYSSLLIPPYDELWPKQYAPKNPHELLDEDYNRQFLMEQARSFVWGMQPTIANYQPLLATERKIELDYLLRIARIRYKGLKYLLYGEFLRSPDLDIPKEELKISRLSIYAGRYGESITTFTGDFPLVYSGTWRSDDQHIGIALASISDNPYQVNCNFEASDYGLSVSGKIYIIDEEGSTLLSTYSNNIIKMKFDLQGRGLCLVEIIPDK